MSTKSWYTSKVLWFNALVLLGTFLVDPGNELTKLGVDPTYAERSVAVGNMLLRFVSTAQLVFRGGGE